MAIKLATTNLKSRVVRSNLTGNGVKSITGKDSGFLATLKNFVGNLFDKLVDFKGWLHNNVFGSVRFSFSDAFGWLTQTAEFIYNFDWQQTDEDLDQQLETLNRAVIAQFGQTIGTSLGWTVCGIVPSAGIGKFNPVMGAYLLQQVGEEAMDEILSEFAALLQTIIRAETQKRIIKGFKNTRKAIKEWNKGLDPNSWQRKALDYALGDNSDKIIKTWGDEDRKPWSFRLWTEEKIESIKNPDLRTFVEQSYESFLEACVEAGYVVAQGLDSWILQQQMTADRINGEQQIVEIQPDREIEEERIVLAGGENHIRSQLPQVMANYHMVENRDVGQWVGQPVAESTRKSPNELTLRIQLYSKKTPPIRDAKQRTSITLPDVKRNALDFDKIKRALGGKNGYMYGRFLGKARLDNGKTISVYSNSTNEAEERLKELVELIEPEILGITVTEEVKTGVRANGKPLEKEPIRIYPFSIYLENKQKILNQSTDEKGFQSLDGSYRRKTSRIQIWPDEKPSDFDEVINELLRTDGPNS